MPRLKHSSRAALETLVPVALSEGWTVRELAVAAHCGKGAAADALRAHRAATAARLAQEQGAVASEMRRVAGVERLAAVHRLREAGGLADSLLAMAAAMLEALDSVSPDDGTDGGGKAASTVSPEDRLLKLASVVQKATAASAQSWACLRDASGLGMADRVQESELIAASKARAAQEGKSISPIDVEVIFG